MLVLSRKPGEVVYVGADVRITVVSVEGHRVRLGVEAPQGVLVLRGELREAAGPPEDKGPADSGCSTSAEAK